MKKKLKIVSSVIVGVLIIPIVVAYLLSLYWALYWAWNGFLLNLVFDTSGWERDDFLVAKVVLVALGILAGLLVGVYFSEESNELKEKEVKEEND